MKKILITGCAGFIGSHLTKKLLELNYEVIGIDTITDSYPAEWKIKNVKGFKNHSNFSFYKEDILNTDKVKDIFKSHKPDGIIHLAAMTGVRPSVENPHIYQQVNIQGTLNLLELAKTYSISKFIFASSSSVYGNQLTTPFSENDKTNYPVSPYAATKKSGEILCYTYSHLYKIPTVCLRFFTVYGPNGRPDMAPYLFTEAILKGKEIKKFGNGETMRDYTYIDDIVKGIVSSIDFDCTYEVFNLGNSNPVSLNTFISTLEKITNLKANVVTVNIPQGDVTMTYADITKANKMLNYKPTVTLEEGLRRFVTWFKEKRLN